MANLAFLLDVDNTLIDNDQVKDHLVAEIRRLVGDERADAFWSIYEEVREELDYVDMAHTLGRFRAAYPDERHFPQVAGLVVGYPYDTALYPRALEVVQHLKSLGQVAILSDGDPVFQPAKIARSGLAESVDSNVFVYTHKEERLDDVAAQLAADIYVLIDDKPTVLRAAKVFMPDRLVTVHIRQGKYAQAHDGNAPAGDLEVGEVADLLRLDRNDFEGEVIDQRRGPRD
jgi:FMN phosphatase YigB (HAD superfamily)